MDFEALKEKAIKIKNTTFKKIDEAVEKQAEKLQVSKYVLRKESELEDFIKESKNYKNKETWNTIKKRVIVIFAEKDTDFYKSALYMIPILYTKSWSQNMKFKISNLSIKKLKDYEVKDIPSMVVFENKEVYKVVSWTENIKKVVKSLKVNINDTIEKL